MFFFHRFCVGLQVLGFQSREGRRKYQTLLMIFVVEQVAFNLGFRVPRRGVPCSDPCKLNTE